MYSFDDIKQLISEFRFNEEFDMIIAVANGGIIPAAIINQRLLKPFNIIKINLRDSNQSPLYDTPQLIENFDIDVKDKVVLVVEDRVKSGASLSLAKKIIEKSGAKQVKTFAVNGKADYSLLDVACFKFPWLL